MQMIERKNNSGKSKPVMKIRRSSQLSFTAVAFAVVHKSTKYIYDSLHM